MSNRERSIIVIGEISKLGREMKRGIIALLIGLIVSMWGALSLAQTEDAVKVGGKYYKRKTVISFTGEKIEGKLTRPDNEYIEVRKRVKLKSLISLREDWKKRIVNSVSEL